MPNALPRSAWLVNVVVSSDSAAGTSSAANAPWQARAVIRMVKLAEAPPMAETQQAAERQGVGGDHPLSVHGGKAQVALCGRQRDVHDRQVQDHHELRQA